jgi:hypothetical protein
MNKPCFFLPDLRRFDNFILNVITTASYEQGYIIDRIMELTEGPQKPTKNPAVVALGRMGGLKGGAARAKSLSAKKRSRIAKQAAMARWRLK